MNFSNNLATWMRGHAFDSQEVQRPPDVPIAVSLGRHTDDKMFSFYMESPPPS